MRKARMFLLAGWLPALFPSLVLAAPVVRTRPAPTAAAKPAPRLQASLLQLLRLRMPSDLTVAVTAPTKVAGGQQITVKLNVKNIGSGPAGGTADVAANYAYMVDLVLSSDNKVPVRWAVQPVYTGKTKDDFVEDMLMQGGRVSNTTSLAAGAEKTYSVNTYIPRNISPGAYYLAAVVDPGNNVRETNEWNNVGLLRIEIAASGLPPVHGPAGVANWVLVYGVGGTTVNQIKPSGLVDYTDWISGLAMNNAPFGGRLGFRLGASASIPSPAIKYYRWLYRRDGAPNWSEFTETVAVHYVREVPGGPPVFPIYVLGPKVVGGMNLYEFRPASPPEPGAHWPTTDVFGDIYSGFLSTEGLPDGRYTIRLEVYSPAGVKVMPPGGFQFVIPDHIDADGTIWTRAAAPGQVVDGGFQFALGIDNRACIASIDPPSIGDVGAVDECGFLRYDPASGAPVRLGFQARQPGNFARFVLSCWRGADPIGAASASGEVSAAAAGAYSGDGSGGFSGNFPRPVLLGACREGAFALNLYVYAKATTGWGHRITRLDASDTRAFALAPR